ncbi:MAG: ABC transporter ATP-binding protein [Verrucomicrobia bacterium]|nr:MAG: ABC transporter ATP-binding protein [Verrucomicrobiota bacterium]
MSTLVIRNISKQFSGNANPALRSISLDVPSGKILALVGASGSGKSTLLRILAGLEKADDGEILLGDEVLFSKQRSVPAERRGIGMVFQNASLFPHLTVSQNVLFGIRQMARVKQMQLLEEMLECVGLQGMQKRYPHELSGGERQRAALARALARSPKLMLLDEPFSSLDSRLRQSLRDETRQILKNSGATAVFVTHDTSDALAIAERIAVLRDGELQQVGAPQEVYHAPANAHVAAFFGRCNFMPLRSLAHPNGARMACHIGPPGTSDSKPELWVRPEDLELVPPQSEILTGLVTQILFAGTHQDVWLECLSEEGDSISVEVRHHSPIVIATGERWGIAPRPRR